MLQLKNSTPFAVTINCFPDPCGIDTLFVTAKATFSLSAGSVALAGDQLPLRMADEFWGEPGRSSLRYACELHPSKPSTDVVVVGAAHAPGGKAVGCFDVQVQVSSVKKTIRVFGDRVWQGPGREPRPSAPVPFTRMPIVYERAFGGIHQVDPERGQILFEPRNPVGLGFAGGRRADQMEGHPLPNLEDPGRPLRHPCDGTVPAGLGYLAQSWEPRRSFAGTYDAAWEESRAPYLPEDFDSRHFNAAHPDLICTGYLKGGEPVALENLHPAGRMAFFLPRCEIGCAVEIGGEVERPVMNLETVLIEPDEERLSLIWRSALGCDKKMLKISEVQVALREMVFEGAAG